MGRHTIGDRRGSVRGAPPEVYAGFISNRSDDRAPWADLFRILKHWTLMLIGGILIVFVFIFLWATGCIPDQMAN